MDEQKKDPRFPGNSYSQIAVRKPGDPAKREVKKVEKVALGKVGLKKKSLGEKFADTFLATDLQSVIQHVIFNVLIPAAKDTMADAVKNTVNMMLFGDRSGRRGDHDRGRGYNRSYDKYYNDRDKDRDRNRDDDRRPSPRPSSRNSVDDVVFETRADAEEVLDKLRELIDDYRMASIKDLYGFAGLSTDFTKDKYGWYNLDSATVIPDNEGYMLSLPKPVVLDN